jgi:hypothetical protein
LQAAAGEGAVVDVEIGVAVIQFHFIGVAGDADGKYTGGVHYFLRHVGAQPAEDLFAFAFVL